MDKIEIANDKGRKFRVQIVRKGDRYGLDKCLTHADDEPMVEFYDLSYPEKFGAEGQFVSRYSLSTLQTCRSGGICLQGGVPAWNIDDAAMATVYKWMKTLTGG